jgi:hypothetical protein
MQHRHEYSVAAFATLETKLHIMESNMLRPVYVYHFYIMKELGRDFNKRNEDLSTSRQPSGYT